MMASCVRSVGPRPLRVSTTSATSSAFPIACPSGRSMLVMSASTRRPMSQPIRTMVCARRTASGTIFMNAPEPTFTSSRMQLEPAASFLLMMELAISGMEPTVAVTSRRAYMSLSAGTRLPVCPTMAPPCASTQARKSCWESSQVNPGMLSSLSRVPPVWPSPRPLILATKVPPGSMAASMGTTAMEVLSPTPPVECLSTVAPGMPERSTQSPERIMCRVRLVVSAGVMPRR